MAPLPDTCQGQNNESNRRSTGTNEGQYRGTMKEQMTMMVEAMMIMRKMMEDNAARVVVASTVTEMDPIHSAGFNQVNRPVSDVVG